MPGFEIFISDSKLVPVFYSAGTTDGERMMHSDARLTSLQDKHLRLDQAITEEQKRSWPDGGAIKRMKLEKLHLKEEIDRLTTGSRGLN